jgi:hypothetical protein
MCEARPKENIISRLGEEFKDKSSRKKKGETNKLIGRAFSDNGRNGNGKKKGAPPGRR